MEDGVKKFLYELNMNKYYDMFKIKGFDDVLDIPHLTAFDLEYTVLITSQSDRATILSHAQAYQPSSEYAVRAWLCSNSLEYYYIAFLQSDLTDLRRISQLSLPNEDLYDELEIVLPGHRKRLERAVKKLKLDQGNNGAAEVAVSYGWWGKPACLPQAKFDFLCVKGLLFSSPDPKTTATIDFMVDSGSDVSTVQEDTLNRLNLDLIGPVYSCGIHGGNHTNLYKATLRIGDQELDIEVLGSNYDSLGSRVVRHFRHIIDGHQHIWLKGNNTDPVPAIAPIEYAIAINSSHLPQEISHKEVPLSIANIDSSEDALFNGSWDQLTRTSDVGCSNTNSETQQMEQNSFSANCEINKRDKLKRQHADDSQINVFSTQTNSTINETKPSQTETPCYNSTTITFIQGASSKDLLPPHLSLSSPTTPSSNKKHKALCGKGKLSLKSNRHDLIKSSLKTRRRPKISKSSNNFLQTFSYGSGNEAESTLGEVQCERGVVTDSVNSSAGTDTLVKNKEDEQMFSENLPEPQKDASDVVDGIGEPSMLTETLPCVQSFHGSRDVEFSEKEQNSHKYILETFSQNINSNNLNLFSNPETYKSDIFDVVHIGDIFDDIVLMP